MTNCGGISAALYSLSECNRVARLRPRQTVESGPGRWYPERDQQTGTHRGLGERLCRRMPPTKAIVALARKMLVMLIWHVLTARAADRQAELAKWLIGKTPNGTVFRPGSPAMRGNRPNGHRPLREAPSSGHDQWTRLRRERGNPSRRSLSCAGAGDLAGCRDGVGCPKTCAEPVEASKAWGKCSGGVNEWATNHRIIRPMSVVADRKARCR